MWQTEEIEDESNLFVRVHKNFVRSKDNKPSASAFTNTPKSGNNLSSDWNKHSTPESSRDLIGKQKKPKDGTYKDPSVFFIWAFNSGKLRNEAIPKQKLEHDPVYNQPEDDFIPNNRAHSIIIGDKPENNAEFRVSLLKIGDWAIAPVPKK
ncbi:hypothetical protein WNY78_02180 [Psychroserpens sp. AS72]|uniref:hypothetical protein n=1 Tax=Psychroserpens sp. AS72 TaxID=3135775 RepID=UPI00316C5620